MALTAKALDQLDTWGDTCYVSNNLHIAALKVNLPAEGKDSASWHYKANTFTLAWESMTGVKDEKSGKFFLVGTVLPGEGNDGSFSINCKEKVDGKSQNNKEKASAANLAWNKSKNLCVVDTSGCEAMALVAECLADLKVWVKPRGKEHFWTIKFDKPEDKQAIAEAFAAMVIRWMDAWTEGCKTAIPTTDKEYYPHVQKSKEAGLLYVPVMAPSEFPQEENDDGEEEPKHVPFEGDLPIWSKLGIDLPEIKAESAKKGYGGGYGGAGAEAMADQLKARKDFVIAEFAATNPALNTLPLIHSATAEDDRTLDYFNFLVKLMGKQ